MFDLDLLRRLADPACFPGATAVEVVQTHISVVCVADSFVYKFKKPVRLPFLDYASLERRRHFCREEVRLNRRLCTDVYLGTAGLLREGDDLRMGPLGSDEDDRAIDIAVVMRRLPKDRMLDEMLRRGNVDAAMLTGLARRIAAFQRTADAGPEVRAVGAPDRLARLARANFVELQTAGDQRLFTPLLHGLARATAFDFERLLPVLEERAARGRIVDGHGDLHARNVCMTEPPVVYDCIEFAAGFRCADVATEVAFLLMDLRYRGASALGAAFLDAWIEATGDTGARALMPALVRYRAMVRCKVAALAAVEGEIAPRDRNAAHASAVRHLQLAAATVVDARGPLWLLVCGPPGSGKSSLADQLRFGSDWPLQATDRVRKELAGLRPTQRCSPEHYGDAFSDRTYGELLGRAAATTRGGAPVVLLDGNFPSRRRRAEAVAAARSAGARLHCLSVDVDPETARERIAARMMDPGRESDADPAHYDMLRARYVSPSDDEGFDLMPVDGQMELETAAAEVFTELAFR